MAAAAGRLPPAVFFSLFQPFLEHGVKDNGGRNPYCIFVLKSLAMDQKEKHSVEVVQIPLALFTRMSKALIGVEKFLEEKGGTWLNEEAALKLLGCKRTKLFGLKESGEVTYKAVGRAHQYDRKSLDKYNQKMSSK